MSIQFKLGSTSVSTLWYILLVVLIPGATLVVAGLVFLWQKNLLLPVFTAWLLVSAIAYAALFYWPHVKTRRALANSATDDENEPSTNSSNELAGLPQQLQTRTDWSELDHDVWNRCCLSIESQLKTQPEWQALPELALEQLTLIAQQYHGTSSNAQLRFTVPELLLVISVTSSRYRQLVIEHVPFIDKFTVATGNTLFDQKQNLSTGYRWLNRLRRTVRLLNPASAVVGELRDVISNKIFSQASEAVQSDLKKLLLQEAAQVGIDLYSGKLIVSEEELASFTSKATQDDAHRRATTPEPIRILLIGQTSVGKSSLINALGDALQAEIGVLPVTNQLTAHELRLQDDSVVTLIDTPGIDGVDANRELLSKAALEADLILWVAKATQPARAPDQQLLDTIKQLFTQQTAKLQPPIILVLTHIDQLSPKAQWEPPYDLEGEQPKAKSIAAAIRAALSGIGFGEATLAVPVYVGNAHEHYNADALAAQIMMLSDDSMNVQLNRRRLELGATAPDWRARWTQTKKLGRVIGRSIVNRVKN